MTTPTDLPPAVTGEAPAAAVLAGAGAGGAAGAGTAAGRVRAWTARASGAGCPTGDGRAVRAARRCHVTDLLGGPTAGRAGRGPVEHHHGRDHPWHRDRHDRTAGRPAARPGARRGTHWAGRSPGR